MPRSCGTPCCFQWRSQRRPRHEATLSSRVHRTSPRHGELSHEPVRRHHRKPRTAPTSGSAPPGSKGISRVAADLAARARASAGGPVGAASAPAQAPGWGSAPCGQCSDPCPSPPSGAPRTHAAAEGRFRGARTKYGRLGECCQQVVPWLYADRSVSQLGSSHRRVASIRCSEGPDAVPARWPRTGNPSWGSPTFIRCTSSMQDGTVVPEDRCSETEREPIARVGAGVSP
jgi:hypothetical protein